MIGQGSPLLHYVVKWACAASAVAAMLAASVAVSEDATVPVKVDRSSALGPDGHEPGGHGPNGHVPGMQHDTPQLETLRDQATAPFEFRADDAGWQVMQADRRCQLRVTVRSLAQHTDKELTLRYELVRVEDGVVVAAEQTDLKLNPEGDSEPVAIASSSPSAEGVYEIRCSLREKRDRLWSRFSRKGEPIAMIRFPWLTYRDADQLSTPPDTDFEQNNGWIDLGEIASFDPSIWQVPSWIPEGATRLVPNVKWVGATLKVGESLSPWFESSPRETMVLKPGGSFIGVMSDLRPHVAHQLTIKHRSPLSDTGSRKLKVEFSQAPTFDQVSKSTTLEDDQPIDVTSQGLLSQNGSCILTYPIASNEFVRITNKSADVSITIESLHLERSASVGSLTRAETRIRNAKLSVTSEGWFRELTRDLTEFAKGRGYSPRTLEMYRQWKGLERLAEHAGWMGYQKLSVPYVFGIAGRVQAKAESSQPVQGEQQWFDAVARSAIERWSETQSSISVEFKSDAKISEAEESIYIGQVTERQRVNGKSMDSPSVRLIRALNEPPRDGLILQTDEFPLAIDRSLRELLRQYTNVPINAHRIGPVENSATNIDVMIRDRTTPLAKTAGDAKTAGGAEVEVTGETKLHGTILTIVNAAPWASRVELSLSAGQQIGCRQLDGSKIEASDDKSNSNLHRFSVAVEPCSITNLKIRSDSESIQLRSWRASMVGGSESFGQLKSRVSKIVGGIGTLALPPDYVLLRNGSFEETGSVGVVGWMHTQFPKNAVAVDSSEAIAGSSSIRMTTDSNSAGRTWLVSEQIPVPSSGRLAVSLAIRAGARNDQAGGTSNGDLKASPAVTAPKSLAPEKPTDQSDSTGVHRVRISLEGNRNDQPIRIINEVEVPTNGQWQSRQIVLEAEQLHQDEIDSLRLTIDSLSAGRVWIDDVHLHDKFATHSERTALQGNAFLAIQGLQHGDLKPAAKLLHNDWSKYLLAQSSLERNDEPASMQGNPNSPEAVSLTTGTNDVAMDPKATAAPRRMEEGGAIREKKDGDGRESIAERLRDWLPKPIRF